MNTDLITQLKQALIGELNLEGIRIEDIDDDAPLFGEGLGLDSLDAVELVVLVQRHFGVVMKDVDEAKRAFASTRTLAEYISAWRS